MTQHHRHVLAIDIALSTGWAHSNGQYGAWCLVSMATRFATIRQKIHQAAESFGLDLIAYEQADMGSPSMRQKADHNRTLGVVLLCAQELGVDTVGYHPTTIKCWFTGDGRADKAQMVRACRTHLGIELTLAEHDVADALAILHMALQGVEPPQKKPRKQKAHATAKPRRLF